ncbi:MAG: BtpA/SgcQ family protein [Cyanobacteria bacterium]|nr:BtpA/SgcQ family protein [Cyanobacteriota bacterium]
MSPSTPIQTLQDANHPTVKPAKKPVIGVIHLLPLPGSAAWSGDVDEVIHRAEQEAAALASGGVSALLFENFYDQPYTQPRLDPAGAVLMALAAERVKQLTQLPLGISVLNNDPKSSLAIAMNVQAAFIRIPVLVGTRITEAGMVGGCLQELLQTQHQMKLLTPPMWLLDVSINNVVPAPQREAPWRDPLGYLRHLIQTMLKHPMEKTLLLSEQELAPGDIEQLKQEFPVPMWVGTALNRDNAQAYYQAADGILLGAGIKKDPIEGLDPRTTVDLNKIESVMRTLTSK